MNAFLETLGAIRAGDAVDDLAAQLADLVKCVRETGRAGALTLKLTVKPASKGDTTTLLLEDAVAVKRPAPERGATIFYATSAHALTRQDPRQPELAGLRTPVAVTPIRPLAASQE